MQLITLNGVISRCYMLLKSFNTIYMSDFLCGEAGFYMFAYALIVFQLDI